ncbi:hypothetical protein [Streptomyces rimosus]
MTRTSDPETTGHLDMPGKVTAFLRVAELTSAERATLDHGMTVRRGLDHFLRVTTASFAPRRLRQPGHCSGTGTE